ncbi:MAG: hypothetical protein HY618_04935, partial [Candidatus Tectomicrobia bacterium]|nr:hypothetical protein [Candidatus Tectomicrobia bacterium]
DDGGNGYAQFVCVPQEFVALKPKRLSFTEAAAVPLVSLTAYEAVVMKARFERGESAFVAGASGGTWRGWSTRPGRARAGSGRGTR